MTAQSGFMFHNTTDERQACIALAGFIPTSACALVDLEIMAAAGRVALAECRDAYLNNPYLESRMKKQADEVQAANREIQNLKYAATANARHMAAFLEAYYPGAWEAWIADCDRNAEDMRSNGLTCHTTVTSRGKRTTVTKAKRAGRTKGSK